MNYSTHTRTAVAIGPDGTEFRAETVLNPNACCVIYAWSESAQVWMRQSRFVPYSQAGKQLTALCAECPTVRPVLAPARFA